MTTEDQTGNWAQPVELKHSGLGITSFALSILVGFLLFAAIAVAGVMESSRPGGLDEESPVAVVMGLGIIALLGLNLVAFGIGIGALFQRDRKKIFAILGTVFSSLIFLGCIALFVVGSMMEG